MVLNFASRILRIIDFLRLGNLEKLLAGRKAFDLTWFGWGRLFLCLNLGDGLARCFDCLRSHFIVFFLADKPSLVSKPLRC